MKSVLLLTIVVLSQFAFAGDKEKSPPRNMASVSSDKAVIECVGMSDAGSGLNTTCMMMRLTDKENGVVCYSVYGGASAMTCMPRSR